MSTPRKLMFGFGLLLLLLIGIGLFVSYRLATIERALGTIMEVQEPATATAYKMSLNVSATAAAVLAQVRSGDPAMRLRAASHHVAFDQFVSGYNQVARLPASRQLGERIRISQRSLRMLGDSLMNLSDQARTASENYASGSDALRSLLNRELRLRIDTRSRDGVRKLAETERLEADLNAMGQDLAMYLALRGTERRARVLERAEQFRATLVRFGTLRIDDAERGGLARVRAAFADLEDGARGTLELADRVLTMRTQYVGAASRLERLVDDGIHSLARNDLIEAQRMARRSIHFSVFAVLVLLIAGILVGALTAVPVGRSIVRAENALRDRMQELAVTHARKDEFLGVLGHELRNPLAPLSNSLHVLESRERDLPDDVTRAHDVMRRQVESMSRLVDDLLDVSRISQGKITLKREPVNLTGLLVQTVEDLRPTVEARGGSLTVKTGGERMWVDADPTRIAQMVSNLMHNAIKYTRAGGAIEVSLARAGGMAEVRIDDDGLGIPAGMIEKIFEPFNQVDSSLTRSQGGLGIGLALVRRLALMHGGSVTAASPGPDRGSTFTLRLPLIPTPPLPMPAPAPAADGMGASRRVLVVDDNRDSAETMAQMLRVWGHEVRLAFDGADALSRASEWPPELVLLDIGLPGLDGYQVAERLRKESRNAGEMTLIAITGLGQQEDRDRAMAAGFDHHLTKPVRPATLRKLLVAGRA